VVARETFEVMDTGYFRIQMITARCSRPEKWVTSSPASRISRDQGGDTVTLQSDPCDEPLPGFTEVKPMVFSGLYPVEAEAYVELREALEKLRLNDSSFIFERKPRRRWDSDSAAASWDCSTWRSSRSASSASTT